MFNPEDTNGFKKKMRGVMCAAFAIALLAIAGITSPPGEAQATGKGAPQRVKLTPQQLEDLAKAQLATHGTLSPRISNPNADSATAGIIAALRSQKQMADMEFEALSTTGPTGPQPSPAPSPAAPAASSGKAGGKPGANAVIATNVSQPRTNSVAPSAAPQHPMGAEHPQTAIPCRQPNIGTVNGKAGGIIFTPEAEWNLYTIKGCGFGNAIGNIYLKGPFKGGRIPLQIRPNKDPKHPTYIWRDTAIVASLDSRLTGEVDQDNVTLVIEPASGSPMEKPGFKFFAARETVELKSIPSLVARLGVPGAVFTSPAGNANPMAADVYRGAFWDPQNPNKRPFEPGSDVYDFSPLAAGFNVASAQIKHFDAHSGEDLISKSKGWNVVWEANSVRVNWGVAEVTVCADINCNSVEAVSDALAGNPPPATYHVETSMYGLNVWVSGPRGVSPWRAAMGGQPNPAAKPNGLILAPHQPNPANKPHP